MADGTRLLGWHVCHGFATRGIIESSHRVPKAGLGGVQVRRGLRQIRVSEHFLDMMQRPAGLVQSAGAFVTQIVEVQIDRPQRRA